MKDVIYTKLHTEGGGHIDVQRGFAVFLVVAWSDAGPTVGAFFEASLATLCVANVKRTLPAYSVFFAH